MAAEQRVAWLMATSRLFGANTELAHQEAFAQALRAEGFNVDNSRISRWESGARQLPTKVLSAYESILGLPEGGLVAVAASVYRSRGDEVTSVRRTKPDATGERDLDAAFAAVEDGTATGATWLRLADALGNYERVYLNPATWRTLASQLVNELNRSVGAAYVRRNEACHMLLANPVAQRHVVRAIGEVVTPEHAQIVQPALSLLSGLDDPAASGLVLRLIGSNRPLVRLAAANIAPVKAARNHFGQEDLAKLEAFAVRTIRAATGMSTGLHAFDLAATLPDAAFDRICTELRESHQIERLRLARNHGHLVPVGTARSISRSIAGRAQDETGASTSTEPDTMLQRLVGEALFHAHKERRQLAGVLIAASPYAGAVAHGCLALAEESSEFVATRALSVLQDIGLGKRRDVAFRHAVDPSAAVTIRVRALNSLAVSPEDLSDDESDDVKALIIDDGHNSVRHAAMFSLGMNAHHRIQELLRHTDPWVVERAGWWDQHGAALRDDDDDHTRRPTASPTWIPTPRGF